MLSFEQVGKRFGERAAVRDLSFEVRPGEIFALLGPNGAGKTTAVRMLLGVFRPDQGRITVRVDGRETEAPPPTRTGYLPEERGLYREVPVLRWWRSGPGLAGSAGSWSGRRWRLRRPASSGGSRLLPWARGWWPDFSKA